jgi:hypothetical protein
MQKEMGSDNTVIRARMLDCDLCLELEMDSGNIDYIQ